MSKHERLWLYVPAIVPQWQMAWMDATISKCSQKHIKGHLVLQRLLSCSMNGKIVFCSLQCTCKTLDGQLQSNSDYKCKESICLHKDTNGPGEELQKEHIQYQN